MVPAGGVEDRPFEAVDPLDVGQLRLAQRADARDEHLGGQLAGGSFSIRHSSASSSQRADGDLVAIADVRVDAVLASDPAQVLPDLGLRRERPAPVRVGRERERVQVRGHVAGAARVGVIAPGAAQLLGPLEHDEVVDALLLQADRHAQPGEARADDRRRDGAGSRAPAKPTLVGSAHGFSGPVLSGAGARRRAAPSRALGRRAARRLPGCDRRAQPAAERGDLAQRRGRAGRRRRGRPPSGGRRAGALPRCAAADQGPHAGGRLAGDLRLARCAPRV